MDASKQAAASPRKISLGRRVVYGLIPALLVLVLAEIGLRLAGFRFAPWHLDAPLFVKAGQGTLRTARMFTKTEPYGYAFCVDQAFSRVKPEETLRIVMIGGSSVARLGMAPVLVELLETRLGRRVEFINAGFEGCGSGRALITTQEVADYDPDVILIYCGHNEFIAYDEPTTRVDLDGKPLKPALRPDIRIVQLVARIVSKWTYSEARLIESERRYEQREKEPVYQRFKSNLEAMIVLARREGVPLALSTLSYNYGMYPNLISEFGDPPQVKTMSEADLRAAYQVYQENALIEYGLAMRAYERDDMAAARRWVDLSLRHGKRPFRATRRINRIVSDVANERSVPLVDMYGVILAGSSVSYPAFDLFTDQCHLNEKGKRMMQEAFAEAVVNLLRL